MNLATLISSLFSTRRSNSKYLESKIATAKTKNLFSTLSSFTNKLTSLDRFTPQIRNTKCRDLS